MSSGAPRPSAHRFWLWWVAVIVLTAAMAPGAAAGERLSVYAINYPLKYFAERIGGEHVAVAFPVPAGEDPAFWRPTPEIVVAYQRADLILLNGASYAKWIATATLPRRRLVDTSSAFADNLIAVEGVTHSHGLDGAHSHGDLAFTTWLDPTQAAAQAKAVTDALARKRPSLRPRFERELHALNRELLELDTALETMVRTAPDLPPPQSS